MESENKKIFGNIHSFESFATVDGPGVRFAVFFQGCPMRCLYCHNPDTWDMKENKKVSVETILEKYDSVKPFLKNGGLTATGGEPLAQIDFLIELFKKARKKNIHTALDTSGILFNKNDTKKFDELIKYTDLVMLDIKHIDPDEHKKLTGFDNKNVLDFLEYLNENNITCWIRHVVVPDITYKKEYLEALGKYLAKFKNIKALDTLPYHDMAKSKYEELGLDYPLKDTKPLEKEETLKARNAIIEAMRHARLQIDNNR